MNSELHEKPSYKNIVLENVSLDIQTPSKLQFVDYNEIVIPPYKRERQMLPVAKHEFLNDLVDSIVNVTSEVVDYFSFHNIANSLTVVDVLDCLEQSLKVSVISDNDYDYVSDDEEY